MPRPKNKAEHITVFGRYFNEVRSIIGVKSLRQFALESGIAQPTLQSWAMDGARPKTVEVLEKLFVAGRKYEKWRVDPWERDLMNLAGHVARDQYEQALSHLAELERERNHSQASPDTSDD